MRKYSVILLVLLLLVTLLVACGEGTVNPTQAAQPKTPVQTEPPANEPTPPPSSSKPQAEEPDLEIEITPHETPLSAEDLIAAAEPILNKHREYYAIHDARIYGVQENLVYEGEETVFDFYLDLSYQTKFTSVEELPHTQGLLQGAGFTSLDDCRNASKNDSDPVRRNTANEVLRFVEAVELDMSSRSLTYCLAVTVDESFKIKQAYGINDDSTALFPIEELFPVSVEEMYQAGVAQGTQYLAEANG